MLTSRKELISYNDIRTIIINKGLNNFDIPLPVLKVAKALGFDVFEYDPKKSNINEESNGFVFYNDKEIYINNTHTDFRKRFTIGHEIGHIILNDLCGEIQEDIIDYSDDKSTKPSEINADRFSAELLMPYEAFTQQYNDFKNYSLSEQICMLQNFFRVPKKAVLKRIVELDLVINL